MGFSDVFELLARGSSTPGHYRASVSLPCLAGFSSAYYSYSFVVWPSASRQFCSSNMTRRWSGICDGKLGEAEWIVFVRANIVLVGQRLRGWTKHWFEKQQSFSFSKTTCIS